MNGELGRHGGKVDKEEEGEGDAGREGRRAMGRGARVERR